MLFSIVRELVVFALSSYGVLEAFLTGVSPIPIDYLPQSDDDHRFSSSTSIATIQ